MDFAATNNSLARLALSVHNASDAHPVIRALRDAARQALPDIDPDLVEDLLICALTQLTGVQGDEDALNRIWGCATARDAAARVGEVLDRLSVIS